MLTSPRAPRQLNDIFSLVVALQALKLAEGNSASATYSYGWQRAEVLGALINGVFLLGACRLANTQDWG